MPLSDLVRESGQTFQPVRETPERGVSLSQLVRQARQVPDEPPAPGIRGTVEQQEHFEQPSVTAPVVPFGMHRFKLPRYLQDFATEPDRPVAAPRAYVPTPAEEIPLLQRMHEGAKTDPTVPPKPFETEKSVAGKIVDTVQEAFEWSATQTEPPKGVGDFFLRVGPESTYKTIGGVLKFFFYDLAKPFTDATVNWAFDVWKAKTFEDEQEATKEFMLDLGKGVWGHVKGISEFSGVPLGVYGLTGELADVLGIERTPAQEREAFLDGWMTNPAGSLLGIAPIVKGAYSLNKNRKPRIVDTAEKTTKAKQLQEEAAKTENAAALAEAEKALAEQKASQAELAEEISPEVQRLRDAFKETTERLVEEKGLIERQVPATAEQRAEFDAAAEQFKLTSAKEVDAAAEVALGKHRRGEPVEEPVAPEPAPAAEPLSATVKKSRLRKKKVQEEKAAEPELAPEDTVPKETPLEDVQPLPDFRTWMRKENNIKAPGFIEDADLRVAHPNLAAEYDSLVADPPVVTPDSGFPVAVPGHGRTLENTFRGEKLTEEIIRSRAKDAEARSNRVANDPELMTGKLINDVHMWKLGEDILIEDVRAQLSEIAARADELANTPHFVTPSMFKTWKELVQNASEWARRAERPAEGGVNLGMGIDPLEAIDAVRRLMATGIRGVTHAAQRLVADGTWTDPKALMAAHEKGVERVRVLMDKAKEQEKPEKFATLEEAGELAQLNQALREGAEIIEQRGSMKGVKPDGGVKLGSGPDLAELIDKMYKRLRKIKKVPAVEKLKQILRQGERMFIDVSGNVKNDLIRDYGDAGYRVMQKMVLRKGAGARASKTMRQAEKDIYGGLSKEMRNNLDDVIFSDRVITIDSYRGDVKHPDGHGGDAHLSWLRSLGEKRGLTEVQIADLFKRRKAFFDISRDMLKQALDEQLITPETYENLKDFNYTRRQLIAAIDPKLPRGKGKVSVRESGVQSLSKGKETDALETDSMLLLSELVVRTQNRIMANRLNTSMADFALEHPSNQFARLPKKDGGTGGKKGDSTVYYFKDGVKKELFLSPETALGWVTSDNALEYQAANFARIASGSFILKPMATGINPAFALRNLPRDFQHMWQTSNYLIDGKWKSVYSPHVPIVVPQMLRDVGTVAWDAFTRKGRWDDYIDEGGGMEFLVHQGRPLQRARIKPRTRWQKFYDAIGYLNETSEIIGRLALRERALRKGLSNEEATFLARDYLDFSQGGNFTRAVDTAVPYLNARVQATRGIYRGLRRNPKGSAVKILETMALGAALYMLARTTDREALDATSPRDRVNSWNIYPSGVDFDGKDFDDEHGQKRYVYFKLPKDNAQKFFSFLGESLMRKHKGDGALFEVDAKQIVETLKELSPVPGVGQLLPPSIKAALSYAYNVDFWNDDKVWKGPPVPSGQEFDERTPEAFKALGAVGLSPVRSQEAFESLFAGNTVYNQMALTGLDAMLSEVPQEEREMIWAEALKRGGLKGGFGIVNSFIGITHPLNKSGRTIDEREELDNLRKLTNTRLIDRKIKQYIEHGTAKRSDVRRAIDDIDNLDEQDRLDKKLDFAEEHQDLRNYSFWMRLYSKSPEVRAQAYYDFYQVANEQERKILRWERRRVSLFTDRAEDELDRLEREVGHLGQETPLEIR